MNKKIKSITAYHFDFVPADEEQEEIQLDGYKTALEEFDDKSNLIKEVTFNQSEEIEQVYVYMYNEKGILTEEILYYDTDDIVNRKTFSINEKGIKIKEIVYYSEDEYDTIIYHYDDKDKLIEKVHYSMDQEIETTEKFVYADDNLVENSIYNDDSKLIFQKLFKYDEKANETEYKSNDLIENIIITKIHSYDEENRITETLTYNGKDQLTEKLLYEYNTGGKPVQIIDETAFKKNTIKFSYDNRGNLICQEEYNRNNELINKINRKYDENNLLLESDVVINNIKQGITEHYSTKNEYEYFE